MTARLLAVAVAIAIPALLSAQAPPSSASKDSAAPQPKASPTLDFSGTIFSNFQYRADDGPARASNKFDLERVYLTFRMPAGDRASIRVTTDVFQQASSGNDAYYRGWTIRAKYAYLQYDYLNGPGWRANARVGLLHTVFIDYDEQYWPRWISTSPTDRAGYFASADAGIATTVSMPKKMGDVYLTVTNGPGYTSRETDRFKDYAARITLAPWSTTASPLKGVALTVWGYKGATASKFVDGGEGQVGSVGDALDRDRWGIHLGNLNPRLTLGVEYASRREDGETGSNTLALPRVVMDSTGTLISAYGTVRPFRLSSSKPHPLSLVARYDRVNVNTDTDSKYDVIIGGLIWDLSSKLSASVDYQENKPVDGAPVSPSRTWFAHFVARF